MQEPLQDLECIKFRYEIGFLTINSLPVELLKAWHGKGLKCKSTFLARWATLAFNWHTTKKAVTTLLSLICYK